MYVVTSEVAKTMGKGATALGVVALVAVGLPNGGVLVQEARAQTPAHPEKECNTMQSNAAGSMWSANVQCVNYVNNTRIYLKVNSSTKCNAVKKTCRRNKPMPFTRSVV